MTLLAALVARLSLCLHGTITGDMSFETTVITSMNRTQRQPIRSQRFQRAQQSENQLPGGGSRFGAACCLVTD
ncbi:hypothetical protein JAAARDRAFT_32298 [Jaapia argillacea MUCL 33604]|uniref:Secreted protein n=1 Tax=Jaapia argillacea MUCL 33604 TaxID=933084 RepID=A0A067QFB1_9AGAM|nr:hypothetical protein JAAARDRAFT_32298 [Jaapia argillacea MUCL 33604]